MSTFDTLYKRTAREVMDNHFAETITHQPKARIGAPEMSIFPKFPDIADIVNSFETVWANAASDVGSSGIVTDFDTAANLTDAIHQQVITDNSIGRLFMQLSTTEFAEADWLSTRVPLVPNTYGSALAHYVIIVEAYKSGGTDYISSNPSDIIAGYNAAKAIVPNCKVGVSIQYDDAVAAGVWREKIEWCAANMDAIYISTHPGAADPTTADPDDYGYEYYKRIRSVTDKEIVVAETGWPNSHDPADQATFLTNIWEAMRQMGGTLISNFTRHDLDWWVNAAFRRYGHYTKTGTAYAAATTWANQHAWFTPTTTSARVKLMEADAQDVGLRGQRTVRAAHVILNTDDVAAPAIGDQLTIRSGDYRISTVDTESNAGEARVLAINASDQEYSRTNLRREAR